MIPPEVSQPEPRPVTDDVSIVKRKKIRSMFEDVAEELSEMARMLEKWVPEAPADAAKLKDRKKRLKENIKKTNKQLKKLNEYIPRCADYQRTNLPTSLIRHIDSGKSPNTWLQGLIAQAEQENSQAHGELLAIAKLRNTIASALAQKGSQVLETPPVVL